VEVTGMFLPQGNAAAEQAEFDRVAADGGTGMLYLGALDEAEDHEALNLRIRGIDCLDDAFLAAFESRECAAVGIHNRLYFRGFSPLRENWLK
jgi:hypothetical protein